MMLTGDYITPTINGQLFLNKPPLYNWIMALYLKASHGWSAFALRLPLMVATFILGYFTFVFVKKYTNRRFAFLPHLPTSLMAEYYCTIRCLDSLMAHLPLLCTPALR